MRLLVLLTAVLFVCIGCSTDSIQTERNEIIAEFNTGRHFSSTPLPQNINELSTHEFIQVILSPLKNNEHDIAKPIMLSAGFGFHKLNPIENDIYILHANADDIQLKEIKDNNFKNVKKNKVAKTVIHHLSSYAFTN